MSVMGTMSNVTLKRKPKRKLRKREFNKDHSQTVAFRLTESERGRLEERAAELGLSLSDYVRDRLIHIKDNTGRVSKLAEGAPAIIRRLAKRVTVQSVRCLFPF